MTSKQPGPMNWLNEDGSAAIVFAISLLPVVLVAGMAVDMSRAMSDRAMLQAAADAAVLAAATAGAGADATAAARNVFASHAPMAGASMTLSQPQPGLFQVTARKEVPTAFMQIVHMNTLPINATAEARAQTGGVLEVALALDNTGSMINDMAALKSAARSLTDTLFASAGKNPGFRMSVVPFVAAVNPGRAALEARPDNLDYSAAAHWHGVGFRSGWVAVKSGCQPNYYPPAPPPISPGPGGTGASLDSPLEHARRFALEMFGITPAFAQTVVTANTVRPLSGTRIFGSLFLPTGFSWVDWGGCPVLTNPTAISYFDLFRRIPNVSGYTGWKGCVEARTSLRDGASRDYDVTDDSPTAGDPNSQFVPYFWPDEPDRTAPSRLAFKNDYLSDSNGDATTPYDPTGRKSGWEALDNDLLSRMQRLFKYDNVTRPTIIPTGPSATGPNRACPGEVLPLTNDQKLVNDKIASLQAWHGGGTIISEGLMWGWRTLSPNPPYASAQPYGFKNEKVIVLMSDGKNELGGNGEDSAGSLTSSPVFSEYSAYNYLTVGRFPEQTFTSAHAYLNSRLRTACANAKAKGVVIYTVLFRETDAAARQLMQDCASSPQNAYFAADGTALNAVFANVGGQISRLRLSK